MDKVLAHLMTHGQRVADGDRLGKTIIFAKNQDHARFIVERFDRAYPSQASSFARVIISSDPYAQSLIDDFSQPEKAPHIAVSVDMLDTGVDVPEVVNLVFFKVVRSKTKFWQMLGRGTRLGPDLFGPGLHKTFFSVFDFCQNFEFFNQNPATIEGSVGEPLSKRLFVSRVELIAALDAAAQSTSASATSASATSAGVAEEGAAFEGPPNLRDELAERLREEVAGMSLDNFLVRPQRRLVEKYAEPEAWKRLGLDAQAELIGGLAGLPTSVRDDDLAAKQFDAVVLRAQLAILRGDTALAGLRTQIIKLAGTAGGAVQRAHGGARDGADPGGAGRRLLAGRHRAHAGDRATPAAQPDQADRGEAPPDRIHRLRGPHWRGRRGAGAWPRGRRRPGTASG